MSTARLSFLVLLVLVAALMGCGEPSGNQPASEPAEPRQITLDLGGGVSMKLVLIPAGRFTMGSPIAEQDVAVAGLTGMRKWVERENPQHEVTLSRPFYMGVTEVTQPQWKAVMGTSVTEQRNNAGPSSPLKGEGAHYPIYYVSWEEATYFCRVVAQKTGKAIRLPTEAEWEYACRAGTMTPFHFGETISTDQANYDGNHTYGSGRKGVYREKTVPVGSFPPNAWGLYDMHGNVTEWCADWYGEYPSGTVADPTGPASGELRVVRGGSWGSDPRFFCRSASRGWNSPVARNSTVGFRVALDLK